MVDIETCSPHCTCKMCLEDEKTRQAMTHTVERDTPIPPGFEPSEDDDFSPAADKTDSF